MERYDGLTDEELMQRLRDGEQEVVDYMMEKYKHLVRKHAKAMFLVGGDREDLLQEGMIGLYKAIRDYDGEKQAGFFGFANLCIHRQICSAVNASNRQKHLPLNNYVSLNHQEGEEESRLIGQMEDRQADNPLMELILQEDYRELKARAYERLSPFERAVFDCYLEDSGYEDISRRLGRSKKSIDNALQRIRAKLKIL